QRRSTLFPYTTLFRSAPLDGNDDAFLLASYIPGGSDPVGQPASGVMLAMNAPVPSSPALASMPVNPTVEADAPFASYPTDGQMRSEEHTSELQSRENL